MKKNNSHLLLFVFLFLIIFGGGVYFLTINKPTSTPTSSNTKNMELLETLRLTYSDSWSVTNNGTEGVELTKGDLSILITTSQVDEDKTLNQIVDELNEKLKSTKKILSDSSVTINSIPFRRMEYGSLDESLFPSDGLIAYGTLIDNVYLTFIINFPQSGNPSDAVSVVETIRYN